MAEILVPLDGSSLSEAALPLAAKLARSGGHELRLLNAVWPYITPLSTDSNIGNPTDGPVAYLERVAEQVRRRFGLPVHSQVEYGPDVRVILRAAENPATASVVMSTHGRTGIARTVLGSVSESVLRHAPVPVVLLPAAATFAEGAAIRRIVVPLDGSDLAYAALAPAEELAHQLDAELVLLQVAPSPEIATAPDGHIVRTVDQDAAALRADAERYLSAVQAALERQGVASSTAVGFGDPAEEIVRLAHRLHGDLIVLSTHGRSGLDRIRHGSVAESVLRHSRVPVVALGLVAIQHRYRTVSVAAG